MKQAAIIAKLLHETRIQEEYLYQLQADVQTFLKERIQKIEDENSDEEEWAVKEQIQKLAAEARKTETSSTTSWTPVLPRTITSHNTVTESVTPFIAVAGPSRSDTQDCGLIESLVKRAVAKPNVCSGEILTSSFFPVSSSTTGVHTNDENKGYAKHLAVRALKKHHSAGSRSMRSFLSVSVASSGVFGVSGHRLRGPFSKRTSVSSTRSTSLKRAPDRLIDEDPDQSLPFPSRTASRNLPLKTDSCRIFLEDASYHTSLSSVQKSFDGPSSHFLDVRPRLPPRTPSIRSAKNISTSDITFSTLDEALEPFENHWTWAEKAWIIVTTFYLEYVRIARYNELGDPIRAGPQRRILMDEAILGEEDAICLHPLSMFVAYWDLALFVVWMIFSMVLPFIAAFDLPLDMTLTFTYMFTVFVGLDAVVKYFKLTRISRQSMLTRSPVESRRRYLKNYLAIDIICGIPWYAILIRILPDSINQFFLFPAVFHAFASATRIFLQNPLILRASRRLQTNMGHSIMNIIVFMSLLMMFIHFNACVIYIAQKLGLPYDIEPPENVPYTQFETVKKWVKLEADGEPLWSQYILLFFSSTADIFPINGYQPSDRSEQFVITFFSIAGALIYALLVGTIASFSLGLDSAGRKFTEVLDEVNEFMDASDLPESIRYKIRSFFRLKYRGKYFKKGSIMAELNQSLQREILLESFCDLIDRVPFFRNDSDNPNSPFVCCVANVVTIEHYVAGNNVFVQGDQGDAMFFISQGTVDIVVGGNKVGALGEGAFFGEVALLDAAPRSATITASSSVELVRLGKSDLELILEDFPDVRERMKEVYQERLKRIERERAMAK